MAEETTTSARPSQKQIIGTLRNIRMDLDGMATQLQDICNLRGYGDDTTGRLMQAIWKTFEARMWIGSALDSLGEPNTSDNDDKAEEKRLTVAPDRRTAGTRKDEGQE